MTIPFSTRSQVYTMTAGQTGPLDWPHVLIDKVDLRVERERGSGNEVLVLDTDYSVTLVGGGATATVTLLEEALEDDRIALIGLRPVARSTAFSATGAFTATSVNAELDRLTVEVQELRRDVDRAVRRDHFDDDNDNALLIDESFRGKYLGVDDDGDLVPLDGGEGGGGGGLSVPVEVTEGGTGATTPGDARDNLGLGDLAVKDQADFADIVRGVVPIVVESRTTSAPPLGTPAAGTCYRVGSSPSGAWSAYTASIDIAEANGSGGWTRLQPSDGWEIIVKDEEVMSVYIGGAWIDQVSVDDINAASVQRVLYVTREFASGTAGATATKGSWTAIAFNTQATNTILEDNGAPADATFTGTTGTPSAVVSLPAGTYRPTGAVWLRTDGTYSNYVAARVRDVTNGVTLAIDFTLMPISSGQVLRPSKPFTLAAAANVQLEYFVSNTSGTVTIGPPASISGQNEVAGYLEILDLGSHRGPPGVAGDQGADGLDAAYPYVWSTSTSGDPGTGKVAGNNATISAITQIAVSETDSAGGPMAAVLATWDDSTSSVRARLKISKEGATQNFHLFTITGTGTDQGSYWTFPVTYVTTNGSIPDGTACAVLPIEKGDKGDAGTPGSAGAAATIAVGTTTTGAAGSSASVTNSGSSSAATFDFTIPRGDTGLTGPNTGYDYAFDTGTTDAYPGDGKIRLNNATPGSATWAYISKTDRQGNSIGTEIGTWDDSDNTSHRLTLRVWDIATPTKGWSAEITGTFTDATTYWKIPLASCTARSGGAPAAAAVLAVMPHRTGDKGADGAGTGDVVGPASATDNAVVRFDGTTGKLVQNSTVTIADTTGDIAGTGAITPASNDGGALGSASLSFSDLFLASGGVLNWNNGDVTITHSANALAIAGADSGVGISHSGAIENHVLTTTHSGNGFKWAHGNTNFIGSLGALSGGGAPFIALHAEHGTSANTLRNSGAGVKGMYFSYDGTTLEIKFNGVATASADFSAVVTGLSMTTAGAVTFASDITNGTSAKVTTGTIELGHASDTTLARSSAGVVTIEGETIHTNSTSRTVTAAGIELGHASDTSIQRAASGIIAVEGKQVAMLSLTQAWTQQQYFTLATLTDAATIAWDASGSQKAKVTLGGNRTMGAVTNAVEGATYTLWVLQDATGSRTITWTTSGAGSFDFGADSAPTLTTTASKGDLLAFEAISIGGTLKLRFAGIKKGFA